MSKYVVVNENVLGVFRQGRDASLSYVDVISASILRGANQRPGDSMALPLKRVGDEWTLDNSRIRPATPEDFGTFRTLPPENMAESIMTEEEAVKLKLKG